MSGSKDLADRKKEVFDDDLDALVHTNEAAEDHLKLVASGVVCGTGGPAEAVLSLRSTAPGDHG